MSQPELLVEVVALLESADIGYMVTGSFASSLQGEPRLSHDIDLVVLLPPQSIPTLLERFQAPDYLLDPFAVAQAVARRGQFNLLDERGGDKIDFWLLTDDAFDQSRFARRRQETFAGHLVYVSRPEDTILSKLRWVTEHGAGFKHIADARGIYEMQGERLEQAYLDHWAERLKVVDLLAQVRATS